MGGTWNRTPLRLGLQCRGSFTFTHANIMLWCHTTQVNSVFRSGTVSSQSLSRSFIQHKTTTCSGTTLYCLGRFRVLSYNTQVLVLERRCIVSVPFMFFDTVTASFHTLTAFFVLYASSFFVTVLPASTTTTKVRLPVSI